MISDQRLAYIPVDHQPSFVDEPPVVARYEPVDYVPEWIDAASVAPTPRISYEPGQAIPVY